MFHVKRIVQFVLYILLLNVSGLCVFFTQVPAVRCTSVRARCGHSQDVIPKWKDPIPTVPDRLRRRRRPPTIDHLRWVNSGFADRITYFVNTSTKVRAYCGRRCQVEVQDKDGVSQTVWSEDKGDENTLLWLSEFVFQNKTSIILSVKNKTMCVTDSFMHLKCHITLYASRKMIKISLLDNIRQFPTKYTNNYCILILISHKKKKNN